MLKLDSAKTEIYSKVLRDNKLVLHELDLLCSYWKKISNNRSLPLISKYNKLSLEQQMGELNSKLAELKKDNAQAMGLMT
jgi:hypothetical protein